MIREGGEEWKIGGELVNQGLAQLKEQNIDFAFVYGDPAYYGRFGFDAQSGEHFIPPYKLQYPMGWQALNLSQKALPSEPLTFTCIPALSKPEIW